MENQMQVFNFKDQQVDIIIIDGQPHFIGKQVATILGYSDPKKAIRMHVDEEDKIYRNGGVYDIERIYQVIQEAFHGDEIVKEAFHKLKGNTLEVLKENFCKNLIRRNDEE